jgi:hypothetical protein
MVVKMLVLELLWVVPGLEFKIFTSVMNINVSQYLFKEL